EMAILEQLMRRQGRLVPKDVLFDNVYGADALPETNTVPVHVHHLRKQLTALKATVGIETHRGLGYLLVLPKETRWCSTAMGSLRSSGGDWASSCPLAHCCKWPGCSCISVGSRQVLSKKG